MPPVADLDDDDRIGPDKRKNDDNRPPTPADEPLALPPADTPSSPKSSESPSSLGGEPAPALPLKLKPPDPPEDAPLSAPNFVVMAAILGEMTACNRLCRLLIGFGASMPYCLFFAMFV